MTIKEKLQSDLLEAVRKRDEIRRSALRLLKASIQYEEKAKGRDLQDDETVVVLSREAKKRRESIDAFRKANRSDLVDKEEVELAIVSEYLPEQLSREEVILLARNVISEIGAQGPDDRGKVMGKLMPQVRTRADGNMVNEIVAELLSASPG
ncbi:MAG: GatB/YqeY domain-containing protein [Chloroflexi bacterium]|nr:GatB/YqeY domain-containing protein [Chloroflexota bacterium]